LKTRKSFSRMALVSLALLLAGSPVFGQANSGKAVIHLGGAFSQASVDNAETGFFGVGLYAGKMVTNNLCVGFSSGYDMVHRYKYTTISSPEDGGGDFTETFAVVPALVKAKYYFTLTPMIQFYLQGAGGVYNTIAEMGGRSLGGIKTNVSRPGGSIGVGLDYWFLLTTGVGFEFEYHMFTVPDGGDMFSYWSVRVDYGLIKF